ncbi:hypothetical protein BJ085DRAFT_5225, partial [Dimargaris cristalligena]
WPPIQLQPYLTLQEVIPDHVFTIPRFFTAVDCRRWIELAEQPARFPPEPRTVVPRPGHAYRNNSRVAWHDAEFARRLWDESGLAELLAPWWVLGAQLANSGPPPKRPGVRRPVGLNDNIRLYRYRPGQRFGAHYDEAVRDSQGRHSEFTLLIYLNEVGPAAGGETVFYPSDSSSTGLAVAPQRGLALLHRHGAHCLRHEGREVRTGTKYVLRSDVMF